MSRRSIKNSMMSSRALIAAACFASVLGVVGTASAAGAATAKLSPSARSWCESYGSNVATWTGTSPNIPICGPGPDYGGTWDLVTLPGPGGSTGAYFNGTPGFQCVELADRFLAVAYGFVPTNAEGASVAANYHAEYARTTLTLDGSSAAVGHAPVAGDVISFSLSSSFHYGDGHVAVVVKSSVDGAGNGWVDVAQQNVSPADYHYRINLVSWRLSDPEEPSSAEFQYPYAEWLHVVPITVTKKSALLSTAPKKTIRTIKVGNL